MVDPLPDGVRDFIARCVTSPLHAELVGFLTRDPGRHWSAEEVGRELGVAVADTGHALDDLVSRGLLDVRIGERLLYRFAPAAPALEAQALSFNEHYSRRRAAVLAEIEHGATAAVHDFADAFRIRRRPRG